MEYSGVEEGLSDRKEGAMHLLGSVSWFMVGFKAVFIVACAQNAVGTPQSPTSGLLIIEKQLLLRHYRCNRPGD